MADPVSINFTLQNLKCTIQSLQFYQQESGDATNAVLIASLKTTLASNEGAVPPIGMPSALAQSAGPATV